MTSKTTHLKFIYSALIVPFFRVQCSRYRSFLQVFLIYLHIVYIVLGLRNCLVIIISFSFFLVCLYYMCNEYRWSSICAYTFTLLCDVWYFIKYDENKHFWFSIDCLSFKKSGCKFKINWMLVFTCSVA